MEQCPHKTYSSTSRMIDDEYIVILACYQCGAVDKINYTQHVSTGWINDKQSRFDLSGNRRHA